MKFSMYCLPIHFLLFFCVVSFSECCILSFLTLKEIVASFCSNFFCIPAWRNNIWCMVCLVCLFVHVWMLGNSSLLLMFYGLERHKKLCCVCSRQVFDFGWFLNEKYPNGHHA